MTHGKANPNPAFMKAANTLITSRLEHGKTLRDLVDHYDPADERSFAFVIEQVMTVTGSYDRTSKLLGVAVASLHRWGTGKAWPRELTRSGVRVAFKDLVDDWITAEGASTKQKISALRRRTGVKTKRYWVELPPAKKTDRHLLRRA